MFVKEYARRKGDVITVKLTTVRVEEFGGREFEVVLDDKGNKVRDLKTAIQDQEGIGARSHSSS